jgi:hypothetical protein
MTTKRDAILESFVTIGSFDYDGTLIVIVWVTCYILTKFHIWKIIYPSFWKKFFFYLENMLIN